MSACILVVAAPPRGDLRRALLLFAAALLPALMVTGPSAAQTGAGLLEQQARGFSLLPAFALQVPMAHLAGTEAGDGFARPDLGLVMRGYLPLTDQVDLAFDLALPRFKFRSTDFTRVNNLHIAEAKYWGKMLALGARLFVGEPAWGKPYLVATGGMYQLTFYRFLSGVETKTYGAFRPGAAVGGGVVFKIAEFTLEGDLRYHRFTDTGNFGLGDLSWIELAFGLDLHIGRKGR